MSRPFTAAERIGLWFDRRRRESEDPGPPTRAREHADLLAEDRLEGARERLKNYAGVGHDLLEARMRASLAMLEKEGDFAARSLELVKRDLLKRHAPRTWVRDPAKVTIQPIDDATVTADYLTFADGSGLILVCSGLMGLIDLLSKQFVLSSGLTMGVLPLLDDNRIARALAQDKRKDEYSYAVDVALLRWTLLHQRFYGTSASLQRSLNPKVQRAVDAVNVAATSFVIAHECAHHLLGHEGMPHGASTDNAADDVAIEREADDRALEMLELDGPTGVGEALGAVVAVLAADCFERVAFVRSGQTHPPQALRLAAILDRLTVERRRLVEIMVARVRRVVEKAVDLENYVEAAYWKTMYECPDVLVQPHSERTVQKIFETDHLAAGPLCNSDRLFAYIDEQEGLDLLGLSSDLRTAPRAEALTGLFLEPSVRAEIEDDSMALSFSFLHENVQKALRLRGLQNDTNVLCASITLSRTVADRFKGGEA